MSCTPPLILAGDLGGTNFRVAVFRGDPEMTKVHSAKFHSTDHGSVEEMVHLFLSGITLEAPLLAASFGVPGPNVHGVVKASNLGWEINIKALPEKLGIPHVSVLNDLEATAYGLSALGENDFAVLQSGSGFCMGNQCVIAPGTGLGEAGLFWDGTRHTPWACEGGHADFAPTDELQHELLKYLRAEYGSVSFERVVSGMGIKNIYRFLRDTGRGVESAEVAREMLTDDAAAVIDRHAADSSCDLCRATMDLFVQTLGAECSNMALKTMAIGGVFLGGGIPPKIIELLRRPLFLDNFLEKGRLRPLLETLPVKVVLNDETALLGAAKNALRILEKTV
ncbi:MAG: glucokinase [Verrucomicrobiota bacterium]